MEGGGVSTKGGLQGETSSTLPRSAKFSQFPTTQGSTQTLLGDKNQTQMPPGNFNESDPNDSDAEVDQRNDLLRARREKQPQAKRRYTIEPGYIEDEFYLNEVEDEDKESIFAKVQNAREFVDSATAHPEIWCNAVRNMATGMIAYQEQNQEANRALLESKERVVSFTQQLKEKNASLASSQANEERLRDSRNTYRGRNERLKEEVHKLNTENDKLKAQLRDAITTDPETDPDPDDSDREGRRPNVPRRSTAPSGSRHGRGATPATFTSSNAKSNNKYPDVKDFHGNDEDRHEWESWRMHLESKFLMSWELFETELSKILYIRDHCKDVAHDVIKGKADLKNPDHYVLAEDMIQDLEQMFGDFDKEGKADAELQNPKFAMGAKDAKESFDAFHARFTAVTASLGMSEREKNRHLRKLISSRLKYRILDFPTSTSYRELVARLRQVDMALRLADEQSPRGTRGGGTAPGRGGRGGSNSNSRNNPNSDPSPNTNTNTYPRSGSSRYFLPPHIAERLKKEGRCFKCLQPGHKPNEANAPCKDKDRLTREQVTARLAEVGITVESKGTADEPPTYEQQLSEN